MASKNADKEAKAIERLERLTGLPLLSDAKSRRLPYAESERKFLADAIWVAPSGSLYQGVCIEIQGGTWNGGKHGNGKGLQTDHLKCAIAQRGRWLWLATDYAALEFMAGQLSLLAEMVYLDIELAA